MKRSAILLTLYFLSLSYGFSQSGGLDSLKQQLKLQVKDDTTKVILLNEMSLQCQDVSISQSLDYAKQALKIAEQLSYRKGMANAENHMAYCFRILGDSELAI